MRTDKALVWLVAAVIGSAVAAAPAMAQQAPTADSSAHDRVEEIIVTASPIGAKRFDILQGTSSLSGEALDRALSTTLGEALDKLPGLSQTAFGSGASRPIIRGQGGDRIRILSGGIGSIDASSTSPDHAPALDLATAKRVEVVRGPVTLLYGNNAVGGVINVLDGRIPIAEPKDGVDGFARIGVGSNADERSLAAGIDARLDGPFVLHLDGFYRQADDYKVPGFLESKVLREEEDHEHEGEEEEAKGRVDNSDLTQKGATAGLSYLGDWGFLGVSASRFDSNYGVPAGHSHEGEEGEAEEGPVRIDLGQTRLDLMGEVNQPYGIFETTRVRFGWADYEHKELEGGETGTRFLNKGWEGRIEMVQRAMGNLSGAVGVQASSRNFEAIGDEAFLPPSDTDQMGVFTLQRLDLAPFALEGGVRLERQNVTAGSVDFDRDFTTVSVSAGASRQLGDGWMTGVTLSRTQRAPNAEELLSDGAHLATSTYERGDGTLGKETGLGVEATLKKSGGPVTGSVNLFLTDYDKYIYERLTGAEEEGLPVAQFSATDARFWGFEVEAETTVLRNDQVTVTLDGGVDYVRATDRDNDTPLPRIPALSARAGLGFELATVAARFEGVWTDKQKRIADYELPTNDSMVFNASLDWHPIADRDITLLMELRNLTNEEVRLATSFLKDVLPQPGRDFRLSLRAGF
ncbi:TonB-dependent receptor [Niveispirillum cyanobacteriorum]|uniref:TonB-dependent receptor n=1 Tax=Niveispirillum cyanobacteriorum TaxID=1612173 RepID=A0A2K9NA22_9PROT|nr:TonB-dependent receptor [Niveispirillum cyanobacteriorum]AUN30000.1 TonB-dependent receptor [Niveispirillum cyanobacteriorum]GGE58751.1 TonB-dependent receptor [Niveispirillum cyanobacteriorum]